MTITTTKWEFASQMLHVLLAVLICIQLIISLHPDVVFSISYKGINNFFYPILHIWIGVIILMLCICHWFWSIISFDQSNIKYLLPFHGNGLSGITSEIRNFIGRNNSRKEATTYTSGFINGLLLIAVTGMGVSGIFLIFNIATDEIDVTRNLLISIHQYLSYVVWCLVALHILRNLLLFVEGKDNVLNIFLFSKQK